MPGRHVPTDARAANRPDSFAALDSTGTAKGKDWAAATWSTYATQWGAFQGWCAERHVAPLGARPQQVVDYLHERAKRRKLSTVRLSAAAISAVYRVAGRLDPTMQRAVSNALRDIKRQKENAPDWESRHATAIDHDTAVALMRVASMPQRRAKGWEKPAAAAARGRRDAVIVALAYCAGLRRSEIATLVWEDFTPTGYADLEVRVRASEANVPAGGGEDCRRLAGEFARAVDALRKATAPEKTDRVVSLCAHQINHRVQVLADALGLVGVSTHSGRRGLAFELLRRGKSTAAVQAAGGWRSAAMVRHYVWDRLSRR